MIAGNKVRLTNIVASNFNLADIHNLQKLTGVRTVKNRQHITGTNIGWINKGYQLREEPRDRRLLHHSKLCLK